MFGISIFVSLPRKAQRLDVRRQRTQRTRLALPVRGVKSRVRREMQGF